METFFPSYTSWADLTDAEWTTMAYKSMNSFGFVGFQFGEALLIDLGYYDDDVFYGNGAATNTWDGTWTGKNGVNSFEDFTTGAAQQVAIREAFGYNLGIINDGLASAGKSLDDFIGTTQDYIQNGEQVSVTLTLTGILAAAHLRGAWGLTNLLLNDSVSTDEYGTSILQYVEQFGGNDSPSPAELIKYFEDRLTGDEGFGGPTTTGGGGGSTGTAGVTKDTADVVITWNWGENAVIDGFDPTTDTIFVDWFSAGGVIATESGGNVVFEIPGNNQSVTLVGVTLDELSPANFTIMDSGLAGENLGAVGTGGTGTGTGDTGDTGTGTGTGTNDPPKMIEIDLNSESQIIADFDPAEDMVHIAGAVTADRFEIFEESGSALGTTVRIVVTETDGTVLSTTILQGVSLDDLSMANFHVADPGTLDELTSALGVVVDEPTTGGGYEVTYDTDGSNPPSTTGTTAEGGVKYRADFYADDIVDFQPGVDQLDFGGTSVHGMIVTKTPAGEVAIDSPWTAEMQIVQGVSFQDLTIESFGVVGNEHLRQDIGGVLSWELGIGPRDADTVYIRSHEYGQSSVIQDFDPATMKISFLYFGTRERLTVEDTADGLVISSMPSGQSFTFPGVAKADLVPGRVEFHFDQVIEDNLEIPFGFAQEDVTLVGRTMLLTPEAPAGETTDGHQTRTGVMDPDGTGTGTDDTGDTDTGTGDTGDTGTGTGTGDTGTTGTGDTLADGVVDVLQLTWDWGAVDHVANFNPGEDRFNLGSLSSADVLISEQGGDLVIEIANNGGHRYVVEDLQAEDLGKENFSAPDWSSALTDDDGVYDQIIALGGDADAFI